jgi:prepilin-type N-terminal cleavage/methylation domain-containing protein
MGKIKKRAGFTLIEVVVAMGIFFIVLIAFLGSYYSYYRNVQLGRYKTIGENLAQLQLEDIQNLSTSVLTTIVGENSADELGYYPYSPVDRSNPNDISYSDNYQDINSSTDTPIFDSGPIPATFRIYNLTNVDGLTNGSIPGVGIEGPDLYGKYTLTLYNEEIFPHYMKKIVITDLTKDVSDSSKKIFNIEVTVYWTINGSTKHVTVEGLKNDFNIIKP